MDPRNVINKYVCMYVLNYGITPAQNFNDDISDFDYILKACKRMSHIKASASYVILACR
jgi:hypothetical protein